MSELREFVHQGVDLETGRSVAVKFLADRYLAEPEVVRRFLREAQATASLEHPNVVRVHATGENEGHPYLVMEYVEGSTIAERLREEGRIPLAEAVARRSVAWWTR